MLTHKAANTFLLLQGALEKKGMSLESIKLDGAATEPLSK